MQTISGAIATATSDSSGSVNTSTASTPTIVRMYCVKNSRP